MNLTTHLHIFRRLIISGIIPPRHICHHGVDREKLYFCSHQSARYSCHVVYMVHLLKPVTDGLTLRRLMSYIYMEHPFLMFLDHTQRRSTVGRTPLDE